MSEVTQNDVKALYDDASPTRRAVLAQKIGHDLNKGELSETETELAIAICQQLAQDVELTVRKTLSEAIKTSTLIPKDLAIRLANDIQEVSLPVLEFNTVLDDKDLITIIRSGDTSKQLAITHRKEISPILTHTLAEECSEEVVSSLLENEGAEFIDETYETVLNRFTNSPLIHNGMAKRHTLPKHVIERMVDVVSDQLKAYLVSHHPISDVLTERMVLESREDAKRRLLANPLSKRDADKLVNELANKGKLKSELIFRALEVGDRAFFEHAIAKRVGIPVESARILIKDKGDKGFSALYNKAKLPKKDFKAINYLVDVEYHNKRNSPITSRPETDTIDLEPESWLTETKKKKSKWRLF